MVEGVVSFFYFLAHFILHFPKISNLISFYLTLKPQNPCTLKPHNLYSPIHQISSPSAPNASSITPSYQEIPSMNIALSLSPITSLDTHFSSSPITPPSHSHKKIQPYNHSLHSTKCVITTPDAGFQKCGNMF